MFRTNGVYFKCYQCSATEECGFEIKQGVSKNTRSKDPVTGKTIVRMNLFTTTKCNGPDPGAALERVFYKTVAGPGKLGSALGLKSKLNAAKLTTVPCKGTYCDAICQKSISKAKCDAGLYTIYKSGSKGSANSLKKGAAQRAGSMVANGKYVQMVWRKSTVDGTSACSPAKKGQWYTICTPKKKGLPSLGALSGSYKMPDYSPLLEKIRANTERFQKLQQRMSSQRYGSIKPFRASITLPKFGMQDPLLKRIQANARKRLANRRSPLFRAIDIDGSGYIEPSELSMAEARMRSANLSPSGFGLEPGVQRISEEVFQTRITTLQSTMGPAVFPQWIQKVESTMKVTKEMADGRVDEKHWKNTETKRV